MTTPVYMIGSTDISDPAAYEPYKSAVPAIVAKHGGVYLARGGALEVAEGDWTPSRIVLFRFPNRAAAHAFLDDPDYAPYKALRHRVAKTDLIIVDGLV